jgi:hypothetical protein
VAQANGPSIHAAGVERSPDVEPPCTM